MKLAADGTVRLGDQDLRELLVRTCSVLMTTRNANTPELARERAKLLSDLGRAINELNKLRR